MLRHWVGIRDSDAAQNRLVNDIKMFSKSKSVFAQMRETRKLTITVTMSRTAQEALTAALVNNSEISTRNS